MLIFDGMWQSAVIIPVRVDCKILIDQKRIKSLYEHQLKNAIFKWSITFPMFLKENRIIAFFFNEREEITQCQKTDTFFPFQSYLLKLEVAGYSLHNN